ncbi:unnamed protein product, partial [Orchesella dallaii]
TIFHYLSIIHSTSLNPSVSLHYRTSTSSNPTTLHFNMRFKANGKLVNHPEGKRTNPCKVEKKKRKKRRKESFSKYIYKVLKNCHSSIGITPFTMSVMNSFMMDIFERIAAEASRLVKYTQRKCLAARDIQTAVRLILPAGLVRYAVAEGTKACDNYVLNSIKFDEEITLD